MNPSSRLKGEGYLVSTVSVLLPGIPAFKSAAHEPAMLASLVAGAALSIGGMALRWRSHRLEQREKQRA